MVLLVSISDREEGGILGLVELLHSPNAHVTGIAAGALWNLVAGNSENQAQLRQHDGILPLVRLLECALDEVVIISTGALAAACTDSPANQEAVRVAGALTPLAQLLSSGNEDAMVNSAAAMQVRAFAGCMRLRIKCLLVGTQPRQRAEPGRDP